MTRPLRSLWLEPHIALIALSALFKRWRPLAATVVVGFWAMGSRPMATYTVVPIVPAKPAYRGYRIAATEVIGEFE